MRTISSVEGNSQKLDGGAMFGNAPKAMWSKWVSVDEQNRIDLCCRAMLVQEEGRNILFETGIGAFFEPKYRQRYGVVESDHVLLKSLAELGLDHADIDVVVLSHLHFDHAGGLLSVWNESQPVQLLFPKAKFIVSQRAWDRAQQPHPRDRASFIPELTELLKQSGRLHLTDQNTSEVLGDGFQFHFSEGHTPGLMCTEVDMPEGPVVFAADLIPGAAWVHLPISMGYDRFPEKLIDEKKQLLSYLVERSGRLFFTHDSRTALGQVVQNERGKYSVVDTLSSLVKVAS